MQPEHPMCVKDSESGLFKFKEIHQLLIGDKLIKGDGTEVDLTSVEAIEKTVEIVSIDVDGLILIFIMDILLTTKVVIHLVILVDPGLPTGFAYNNPAGAQNSNLS